MTAIRVVLADDQALVRAGFRVLLESADDIEVAGEAANGGEAIALVRRTAPDIVLMDLRMPEIDGLVATRRITGDPSLSRVRVVVLTTYASDENVFRALRAGASGFLVKDIGPADLAPAIRTVYSGAALLSPAVTRAVIQAFVSGTADPMHAMPSLLTGLTEREREIVKLVGCGLSNDEIAAKLVLSPLTVKTHVSRAMTKLGARDRAQLVVVAYEGGLVRPGRG